MMRLQKYLAQSGVASRRQSERLIADGRVMLNGNVAKLGDSVTLGDTVDVDGKPIRLDKQVYILLNKPRGVISSARDTHNRKTVLDCLNGIDERVFPVGRLDMDVEGALLLTNDGELAYRLTHPKFEVDKIYRAWVAGDMTDDAKAQLENGVVLEDGPTAPARVTVIRKKSGKTYIELTIHEGRKREVKRMCEHVGHRVCQLQRVAIGGIGLSGLKPGEWRYLSEAELAQLRTLTQSQESSAP